MRLSALLAALALTSSGAQETADTVLWNGKIVTLDSPGTIAEAIAIRAARILDVGTNDAVLTHAGPATERIDLRGKTVVPGLADNHYHSIGGGPGVDLSRTRTLQEVLEAIAARAKQAPPGEVVVTNSDWHEGQLREQRLPYRDDLDSATRDHPVVVVRGGHEYILNSAALAKWGVDERVQAPAGGNLGRYPEGRLNGELVDTAKNLVKLPSLPEASADTRRNALVEEYRRLNEVGLTSIRYAGSTLAFYRDLEELEKRGAMSIRASVLLRIWSETDLQNLGIAPDAGDEWVRVAGIKFGVDGGFEGGLMRMPYEEPWGRNGTFYGLQTMPTDTYIDLVRKANQKGWRVATHAVGDAAIDLVLEAYERANQDRSIRDRRFAIEHGFIPREDQFPRMKALGLHVTAQDHLYLAAPSLVKYWGAERARRVTPLRSYIDAGIPVSLGTDAPVVPYPPLWVLYHFVTRDTISAGVMGEDQRVSRMEALRAMTVGGASLTFEEHSKGTLERGKLADLVVLEEDILTCEPERIRDMGIALTMVGGKTVFRR